MTPDPVGDLLLDQPRRHQLAAMLGYIAGIHHHIDPDRFDIDLAFLEGVRERLEGEAEAFETTLRVSARHLLALEIIADAAGTYTHRGDPPLMDGVDEDDCAAMVRWLSQHTHACSAPPSGATEGAFAYGITTGTVLDGSPAPTLFTPLTRHVVAVEGEVDAEGQKTHAACPTG